MEEKTREQQITIQLKNGPVIAAIEDDLIRAEGIRYAEQKRFAPPQDVQPWTSAVDCTKPGPMCPQNSLDFAPLGDMVKLNVVQDEDCLRVNVVAPKESILENGDTRGKALPVLVWIHGGGYIAGTADLSLYDTRNLARRGIVVVSIQYRLGIFGYAAIPGIAPANIGLLDQIAGLRWTRDNVSAFGGDPEQVTIFGQSAGGDSVYALMLADGTKDLFRRAIVMSAPFGLFQREARKAVIIEETFAENRTFKKMSGGRDLSDLGSLSTKELLEIQHAIVEVQKQDGLSAPGFFVQAGEHPLPTAAEEPARLKQVAPRVELLIGWAKNDVLPYLMAIPALVQMSRVPVLGPAFLRTVDRVATYLIWSRGSRSLHRRYVEDGGSSSTFRIDWYPERAPFRAAHCIETPLLFGGFPEWSRTPLLAGVERAAYERLSAEVKSFLVAFVSSGRRPHGHTVIAGDFVHGGAEVVRTSELGQTDVR